MSNIYRDGADSYYRTCFLKEKDPNTAAVQLGNGMTATTDGFPGDHFVGCYDISSYAGAYTSMVTMGVSGVWECKTQCQAMKMPFYGFSCPKNDGVMTCNCYYEPPTFSLLKSEGLDCQGSGPGNQCDASMTAQTTVGINLGAYNRGAVYRSNYVGRWLDLRGLTAKQSSTYGSGVASNAIDGNANPDYHAGSCIHTDWPAANDPMAAVQGRNYWTVFFNSEVRVEMVKVTNAKYFGYRLNGFNMFVDKNLCAANVKIGDGETANVACGATGRSLTIEAGITDYLTFCEVQVFGDENQFPDTDCDFSAGGPMRRLDGEGDLDTDERRRLMPGFTGLAKYRAPKCNGPMGDCAGWPNSIKGFLENLFHERVLVTPWNYAKMASNALKAQLSHLRGLWCTDWDVYQPDPAVGVSISLPNFHDLKYSKVEEWYATDVYDPNGFNWFGRVRFLRLFSHGDWRIFAVMHPDGETRKHVLLGEIIRTGVQTFQLIKTVGAGGWE